MGNFSKQSLAGCQMGARILTKQLAIVVQHFFEVRNHPGAVHRIARESTAQLVEESALGHARQRQGRHVKSL